MNTHTRYKHTGAMIRYMVWLFLSVIIIRDFAGCSAEKTAARQAKKLANARQAEIDQLQQLRAKYPCDTATAYITKTDTAYKFKSDTLYRNGVAWVHDTAKITIYKDKIQKVIDQAALQAARDSAEQAGYLYEQAAGSAGAMQKTINDQDKQIAQLKADNDLQKAKTFKVGLFAVIGGVLGSAAVVAFLKFKSII